MKKNKLYILLFIVILPLPLFAYLDPGTGSMLFSALVGIVATLFFVLKGILFKIVDIPSYLMGIKNKKRSKYSIVFYSEGPQYFNVFLPLLKELNSRNIKCTYMTSKENDPALNLNMENVETKFIGEGNRAFFTLNTLEADIVIMTTPGLDVLQIKRSKGVKKYVHITHSAGGLSGYSTFGTDYYDIILTGGEADKEFIEKIEEIRGLKKKEITVTGCTYLDIMRERVEKENLNQPHKNTKKTVMLSPTWGKHGLLNQHGKEILNLLTTSDKFNLIVRPHPQSFISEKKLIDKLMEQYPESENIHWDRKPDGLISLSKADIMISDFSGIIFDFILLFKKPVLCFTQSYDKKGKDAMDYPENPWVINFLNCKLKIKNDINKTLVQLIENKINNGIDDKTYENIKNAMDKYQGEAGKLATDNIENIVKNSPDK